MNNLAVRQGLPVATWMELWDELQSSTDGTQSSSLVWNPDSCIAAPLYVSSTLSHSYIILPLILLYCDFIVKASSLA